MPNRKMKMTLSFVAVLLALQSAAVSAQISDKPEQKYSLAISLITAGRFNPNYRQLRVVETNVSNEAFREAACFERLGVFKISVLYNGEPLQERDPEMRKKRAEEAKLTRCKQKNLDLMPGDFLLKYLDLGYDFPVEAPGTYEVTVSRESDLEHPEKSVTVKSNTISFVVPEPTTQEEHAK